MADLYVLRQGCVRGPIRATSLHLDPLLHLAASAPDLLVTTEEGHPVWAIDRRLLRGPRRGNIDSTETVGSLPHTVPTLR